MDCLFCKIINKELKSKLIYQDDDVIAFLDIDQSNEGHTLLVPIIHYDNLKNFTGDINLLNKVDLVLEQLQKDYKFTDYKIIINNGKKAGQEIFHLHIHIIPFY